MNEPTYLSRSEYLAGKAAFREMVELCGGGAKLARDLRADPSTISRAGSPHHMDRWPCLDQIADAETMAGDLPVTRYLAGLQGHVVVPVAAGGECECAVLTLIGRIAKECADPVSATMAALADGRIDGPERARIVTEIDEAMTVLAALRQQIKEA